MKKTPKEPDTFALVNAGHGAFVMKLDPRLGMEVIPAKPDEILRAMRLGVMCLNTGKSDKELYQAIEGLTP